MQIEIFNNSTKRCSDINHSVKPKTEYKYIKFYHYHLLSDYMESLGVTGIIISAMCIAFGLIFSLPTKMYLTFLLVKRESEAKE